MPALQMSAMHSLSERADVLSATHSYADAEVADFSFIAPPASHHSPFSLPDAEEPPLRFSPTRRWQRPTALPPAMSLFPSMSAADDSTVHDSNSLSLQQLAVFSTNTPPPSDPQWPAYFATTPPSFDSSPHIVSSTSPSPSSDSSAISPSPPPSKHSREQRQLSKRLTQRRADIRRRKRETAALDEMKQLIAAAKQLTASQHSPYSDQPDDTADTQYRVQILEGSVKRMRELELLVDLLSQTCDAQQREIDSLTRRLDGPDSSDGDCPPNAALRPFSFFQQRQDSSLSMSSAAMPSKRVRLLASSLSSAVDATVGRHSLQAASCSPVVVVAMLVECATGAVLDVNDGMLAQGWQRSHIVGRTVMESYTTVMDDAGWQLGEHPEQRLLVASKEDGQMRPASRPAQFERSKRLMREMYAGSLGLCVAVWRVHMADGLLYEVQTSGWIDGWESVIDGDGKMSRRPLRLVSVTSLADCRLIE